ncbi:P-loop containing nucleoside triphosphate hydrolase protein [Rhodocollybia butyracea]|uniref:P-loop containing nucleoside triphosphate hydrolase protein n=1 Tax=Rhodocollybia butyracea TaxID=206335 RepID=A0A9P5Q639_9AGAR|nr:P-loop containing nucleoside triphosphate hydrolase protein [Rhodocollybia butyracea]
MSKSSSLARSNEEQPEPAVASAVHRSQKLSDEADTNIQVIVRCRRRSEREIQDNSPIIVNSKGAKSNQVSIETTAPTSTLGVVQFPPVRTYPFDLVYGPEADQAMIYHDVVSPMLEQVLEGYNCTLFAYGQTGTGKTYTMQGDLTPTPMGNPSSHAGMIPRVLFRLFHQLEQAKVDFSVRVSYIELYNEELRDLLANDLAAPIGSTQPMGMASKDTAKNSGPNIKIFDDANKRGVIIQGIEDVPVKSSADALALLTKGSERRQIAATKFNDHSSRSHSIFSLTVHTKESGVVGEDLLRIGKLNMVDLAGSENIGRSGAENKRAREAGMINQSLLTLGRVINALVDKAQHVPYRESKLTRILQDSLGGRTKTSIIATISPARSNLEETLSTLDYAMSAKSIRNKPEINQRMTRNSLLKEYIAEIERLKADVLATREKNGIFFSEETWAQMDAERELRETEIEEAKKQVEIIENQMRVVREEFEQSIGLLMKRDAELKDTKQRLDDTETQLTERKEELKGVKVALEEEIVVRQAHQMTENTLDSVATGLKDVAQESIHDVSALFQKLDRKSSVLGSNSKAVAKYSQALSTAAKSLTISLDELVGSSAQRTSQLRENAKSFKAKEMETLENFSTQITEQLRNVGTTIQTIRGDDRVEAEALTSLEVILKGTYETFNTGLRKWAESIQTTCKQTHEELDRSSSQTFSEAHAAVKDIYTILENVLQESAKFFEREQAALLKARSLVQQSTDSEIERLREQNLALLALVDHQKLDAKKAKDNLLQRVSGLLENFVNEQDRGLREAVSSMQNANVASGEEMKALNQRHGQTVESLDQDRASVVAVSDQARSDAKRTRDGSLKAVKEAKFSIHNQIWDNEKTMTESIQAFSSGIGQQTLQLSESSSDAFARHSRSKKARLENTERLNDDIQSHLTSLHKGLGSLSEDVENFTNETVATGSTLAELTSTHSTSSQLQLSVVQKATKALSEQGTKDDTPTGSTPRKHAWRYVDKWSLTGDRKTLLSAWRSQGMSAAGSEMFLAEHLPLPVDDGDLVADAGAMNVDEEPISSRSSSPVPLVNSLQSSSSSTSSSFPPPVRLTHSRQQSIPTLKKGPGKPQQPSIPLADTRNVYTTRGSRRRG